MRALSPACSGALGWVKERASDVLFACVVEQSAARGVTISGVTFSDASLVATASYDGIPVRPDGVRR